MGQSLSRSGSFDTMRLENFDAFRLRTIYSSIFDLEVAGLFLEPICILTILSVEKNRIRKGIRTIIHYKPFTDYFREKGNSWLRWGNGQATLNAS